MLQPTQLASVKRHKYTCCLTPTYADTQITNDYRFHNYKLIITAPNGKVTEQNFPTLLDTTSNQGTSFVPDEVGTYNLTFIFPEQKVNDYSHSPTSQYINDTYMGGTASTTLTVTAGTNTRNFLSTTSN